MTMGMFLMVASLFGSPAMAGKLDKLERYEQDHYAALKVFFEDDKKETKQYLKLKTPAERDQWLKDRGYWDNFYKYDELTRGDILAREPKVGWSQDMVFMAWGPPFRKLKSTKRTTQDTRILEYRLEVTKDGRHLIWSPDSKETYKSSKRYTAKLTLDNYVVSDIQEEDGWE